MTDSNRVFLGVLVDRSGSMWAIKEDTEGGLKAFFEDQKEQPGETEVMLAHFDDKFENVFGPVSIIDAPEYSLNPGGATALLDSIGKFVSQVGKELAARREQDRPGKVVIVITTDGYENSSHEWTADKVRELIKSQEEQWNWTFVFLGANIDAPQVAAQYGFDTRSAMTYGANSRGVQHTYAAASGLVNNVRNFGEAAFTDEDRLAAMGDDD